MSRLTFNERATVPDDVLIRQLEGESVLLNLASESYFGLDEVGTRMWMLVTTEPSIQAAYEMLLAEYDVTPEALRQDLETLLGKLVDHGLLEIRG